MKRTKKTVMKEQRIPFWSYVPDYAEIEPEKSDAEETLDLKVHMIIQSVLEASKDAERNQTKKRKKADHYRVDKK